MHARVSCPRLRSHGWMCAVISYFSKLRRGDFTALCFFPAKKHFVFGRSSCCGASAQASPPHVSLRHKPRASLRFTAASLPPQAHLQSTCHSGSTARRVRPWMARACQSRIHPLEKTLQQLHSPLLRTSTSPWAQRKHAIRRATGAPSGRVAVEESCALLPTSCGSGCLLW